MSLNREHVWWHQACPDIDCSSGYNTNSSGEPLSFKANSPSSCPGCSRWINTSQSSRMPRPLMPLSVCTNGLSASYCGTERWAYIWPELQKPLQIMQKEWLGHVWKLLSCLNAVITKWNFTQDIPSDIKWQCLWVSIAQPCSDRSHKLIEWSAKEWHQYMNGASGASWNGLPWP